MRILISIIISIFVQSALAGGGSVGTMKVKDLITKLAQLNTKQIVYQLQKDPSSRLFTLGFIENGEWKFKSIKIENPINNDIEIIKALEKSSDTNDWVEIK